MSTSQARPIPKRNFPARSAVDCWPVTSTPVRGSGQSQAGEGARAMGGGSADIPNCSSNSLRRAGSRTRESKTCQGSLRRGSERWVTRLKKARSPALAACRSRGAALLAQHTAEAGQAFEPAAVQSIRYWIQGQPYLVNKLANECVEDITHQSDGGGTVKARR
jgi:hypothetical protein